MSSTMRLFVNDNRISTAVKAKNGSILQVYPTKTTFANDVQWQAYWAEATKPKIILRFGEPDERSAPAPVGPSQPTQPAPAPAPAPRPSRSKKTYPASEVIFNTLAQKPAPVEKPKKAKLSDWSIGNKNFFVYDIPAGTYYIGDLCYVLSDDIYDNIFGGMDYCSGIYEEKATKRLFIVGNTAYGDGEYPGSDGNKFAVDAGIIGICSASLVEKSGRGGHMYTFKSPVRCKFTTGRFSFTSKERSLLIDTTGDDDAY